MRRNRFILLKGRSSRVANSLGLEENSSRRRRIQVPLVRRVLVLEVVLVVVLAACLVDSAEEGIRLRSAEEFRGFAITVDSRDIFGECVLC
ncbi:hypothetical protein F511_34127 [Dorcoceras hygrometricum]|uniref:Uncharacterized protein n=1 Tax=Dorcoceras hygrometricum TaxID=472368 RepID=A0A2Z7CDQ9_9LAMI|nr:hypothetical protein F511_34127 [Dorcoceras hygrometricum]